ncbi:MAG TPA: FAD-binding oxidoreductase [Polyangia bacterium]|nr:FAD-binding oxidoreductase [Polyangia bacterium]
MPRPPDTATLEQLKQIVGPEGFVTDADELAPHLTEWRNLYRGRTPILLKPATTAEVAAIVRACAAAEVGIVPQGGNTGLVGGQIPHADGGEVLVNLSRMNRVRSVDPVDNALVAEAGCPLAAVQAAAAGADRLFPLSLASEGSCQIGGNLSTNAGGIHVLRYGNSRDLVLGLEVVTADGEIWDGLRALRKDNTGYELKQLFLGAEGTLGIITAAVLKLFPRHRDVQTAFAAVPTIEAAVALLAQVRESAHDAVLAFELLPRRALEFVTRHLPGASDPLPAPSPWYVLFDLTVARAVAERSLSEAAERGLVTDATLAGSPAQAASLWRLREGISESQKPEGASIKHDISVPVSRIPAFVHQASAAVERLVPGIRPVPFGHVGDGNLHFNLSQPPGADGRAFLARADEVHHVVHDIVAALGGSISAEHGIGQAKRQEIRRYKSAVEIALMARIKAALDPKGIMNPGKGVA